MTWYSFSYVMTETKHCNHSEVVAEMVGKEYYIFQAVGLYYTYYSQGIYQVKNVQNYELLVRGTSGHKWAIKSTIKIIPN